MTKPVWIIDDDKAIRWVLEKALTRSGIAFESFASADDALNAMYDHLMTGATLPPSQIVRTVPRGLGAPPIMTENVPNFSDDPATSDRIVFRRDTLYIPD